MAEMTSISGYTYFVLLAVPYIIGIALTLMLITILKKMHVSKTNESYSVGEQFKMAMLTGFMFGFWTTYAFQEMGEFLIGIPPLTLKSSVTMGILVGISNPFIYDYIRARGVITKKPWLKSLARVLMVKPKDAREI